MRRPPNIPLILAEARTRVLLNVHASKGSERPQPLALIALAVNLGPRFREDERRTIGGYLNFIPLARTPLILMTVPVAGEGVRIRPDTAMEMRRCGICPWTLARSRGAPGEEPRGPGIVG